MPMKSQAQRAWMHLHKPEMAARWEAETPPGNLPERVGKKKDKPQQSKADWADLILYGKK